jgi:hypothetical protein
MKCRFEHDGDCCNSGATQYMCKCKQPCDTIIPVTTADRIRAMSDEELAEFRAGGHCPPDRRFPYCATIDPCSKCWLEYLRQAAKDGDNDG